MLEAVSRTFALSIKQLPEPLRDWVGLAYLLFRVSDCLEDHPHMDVGRKVELLELWEQVLQGRRPAKEFVERVSDLDGEDPEVYVAQQADDLIEYLYTMPLELRSHMITRVAKSTLGMARWQRQGPYVETVEELDDYMHEVAGRVGYLMTDIYAWYYPRLRGRKEELLPLGRQSGLGLQTVNVIRGLRKDYGRGWVFVPRVFLDQAGITREQFFSPGYEPQALQVVAMLADKAEQHLAHGLAYIAAFPARLHRVRLACMWPLFFAAKTLAISHNNLQVIHGEVKITRQDVRDIVRRSILLGWSNRWMIGYYQRLLNQVRRPD